MSKLEEFLIEWTEQHIKHKDIMLKSVVKITKEKDKIIVKHKDKEVIYLIMPFIKKIEDIKNNVKKDKFYTLIMLNNKENFDIICSNWKFLAELDKLAIIFVNPFSTLEKKWIIRPAVHNRICDENSLEMGLKSMFSMVEEITKERLNKEKLLK